MEEYVDFNVDIEIPNEELEQVSINDAIRRFDLGEGDVATLLENKVVWIGIIAISKSERE